MITLRIIANLLQNSIAWDHGKGAVSGFGVRRQSGDAVSYVIKYRTVDGRQRWATIGRHGAPWTPDMARAEAKRILGEVVGGGDPARVKLEVRKAATVTELCDAYLEAATPGLIRPLNGGRGSIQPSSPISVPISCRRSLARRRHDQQLSGPRCPTSRASGRGPTPTPVCLSSRSAQTSAH
jgi:hypothetical protein